MNLHVFSKTGIVHKIFRDTIGRRSESKLHLLGSRIASSISAQNIQRRCKDTFTWIASIDRLRLAWAKYKTSFLWSLLLFLSTTLRRFSVLKYSSNMIFEREEREYRRHNHSDIDLILRSDLASRARISRRHPERPARGCPIRPWDSGRRHYRWFINETGWLLGSGAFWNRHGEGGRLECRVLGVGVFRKEVIPKIFSLRALRVVCVCSLFFLLWMVKMRKYRYRQRRRSWWSEGIDWDSEANKWVKWLWSEIPGCFSKQPIVKQAIA